MGGGGGFGVVVFLHPYVKKSMTPTLNLFESSY